MVKSSVTDHRRGYVFSAHSVCGASSSKAANMGITTNDILKSANWSTESVFQKFYSVPHYKTGFLIFGHLVLVDYLQNHACYKHTQYIKMITVLY